MSKIKNGGLDQYGAEPFEQQQFGAAGVEGVNATKPKLRKVVRDIIKVSLVSWRWLELMNVFSLRDKSTVTVLFGL